MADTRYVEDEDFVPNPTDQYGVLDTSDTGGGAHQHLEEISPIFDVAKKDAAIVAGRALDPDDPDVPESLVVLPQGQNIIPVDTEAHKEKVVQAAKEAEKTRDDSLDGRGPAQRQAAEEGPKATRKVKAQQEQQGAGSRAGSGNE